MVDGERIARVFHEGTTKDLDGTLDDYAFCAQAFLDLAEATGDAAWWDLGARLLRRDPRALRRGARRRRHLLSRAAPATRCSCIGPSRTTTARSRRAPRSRPRRCCGSASSAGDAEALALAEKYLAQRLAGDDRRQRVGDVGAARPRSTCTCTRRCWSSTEGAGRDELLAAARRAYAPTLCIAGPWAQPSILEGKTPRRRRARSCARGPTCSPPVTEPAALAALLVAG